MKRSHQRTTPFFRSHFISFLIYARGVFGAFTSQPRWGQAVAVVNDLLYVSGGKTDQYGSFSYTAAPTTNDLFTLDLSKTFNPTSPSWTYISGSQNMSSTQGQELAWHSLAAYNTSQLLLFGGDGGPNSPIVLPSQTNSAQLLDISVLNRPTWISEPEGWAGQPSRRIHHTTASLGGKIYLIGGEKDDGSSLGYSDHYVFDPSSPSFTPLPTDNGPPDIYGHGSVVLSDGRILVLGGYSQSEANLVPFTTIWSLDTRQSNLAWSTENVSSGSVPPGRRAFAYTWLEGDKVLIHGGSDAEFQTTYSDGWILDTTTSPITWSNVSALTQLGARRDHFAVQVGSQVLFGFGYGTNAGDSVALSIFDYDEGSFTSSFAPQSGPSLTTLPVPSGTGGSSSGGSNGSGSGGTAGGSNPTGGSNPIGGSNPTGGSGDPSSPTGSDPNGGNGGGGNGGDKKEISVITVASVFGVLVAAVAAGFIVVVVIRRRRTQRQFYLLDTGDDHPHPDPSPPWKIAGIAILPWFRTRRALARGEKTRVADKTEGWTVLGLGRPRERVDMLANEDASELGLGRRVRRVGSGDSRSWFSFHDGASGHERSGSGNSGRPSIGRLFSGSYGSFRNIGAGVRRVISGGSAKGHGRQWTDASLPLDPFDPYEDAEGLLLHDKNNPFETDRWSEEGDIPLAARPRGGAKESSTVSKYSDPFEDSEEREVLFDASARPNDSDSSGPSSTSAQVQKNGDARSSQSTLSHSSAMPQLPPLVTTASKTSSSDPSSSLKDGSNAGHASSSSSNHGVLSVTSINRPRTTSIIGSSQGNPTSPMKRSDSWWTRFKRTTSLRDSMQDQAKLSFGMDLDFRDPNPPPGRLGAIKEASGGSAGSPESPEASHLGRPGHGKGHSGLGSVSAATRLYLASGHEESTTSLKTSRTADSAALERLAGRMDVAFREATGTSIDGGSSVAESHTLRTDWNHNQEETWSTLDEGIPRSESPIRSQDIVDFADVVGDERLFSSPTELASSLTDVTGSSRPVSRPFTGDSSPPSSTSSAALKTPISPGTVASRIADYERRMSLDMPTPILSSPSPASLMTPRSQSSVPTPKPPGRRKTPNVKLVHRPELFVANPDRDRQSMSGSSDV